MVCHGYGTYVTDFNNGVYGVALIKYNRSYASFS